LQQRLRQPLRQRIAGERGDDRERRERGHGAGDRRSPAARDAHRQHDRQRLDELDGRGEEDRDDEPEVRGAHRSQLKPESTDPRGHGSSVDPG
jgi:hypothetical protein